MRGDGARFACGHDGGGMEIAKVQREGWDAEKFKANSHAR